MTRESLDQWLDETAWVADPSVSLDAVRYCPDAVTQLPDRVAPRSDEELVLLAWQQLDPEARAQIVAGFNELARIITEAFSQIRQALTDWATQVFPDTPIPDTSIPAPRETTGHRLDGQTCRRHGEPLRAGQCRRCQREAVRSTSHQARSRWR